MKLHGTPWDFWGFHGSSVDSLTDMSNMRAIRGSSMELWRSFAEFRGVPRSSMEILEALQAGSRN